MLEASRKNALPAIERVGDYQFSVFDLTMNAINRPDPESDTGEVIDLTEQDGTITSETDYLQLFYDLIGPDLPPLQTFGPDRELVFAVGETEMQARIGENGQLQFDDLSHLAMLDAEDFITIQLYQNNDMANVLWEWATAPIYVEKIDPQFPDSKLSWDHYYPSLGDKLITVRSDLDPQTLQGRQVRAEIVSAPGEAGLLSNGQPKQSLTVSFFQQGGEYKALFKLSGRTLAPSVPSKPNTDNVKIRFTLLSEDGTGDEANIEERWLIKNNSNTTLAEVLKGEAVFAYDSDTIAFKQDNHRGVSAGGARKVDFVQKMLNQVVPRKRTVLPGTRVNVAGNTYTYIDEDGVFYGQTERAVATFKKHFNLNNETIANGQNSFNKLMKDYDKQAASQRETWRNRIVDKEILAATQNRATDVAVNQAVNGGDTALYELYNNVVEVFIDSMIAEADRYTTEPTGDWVERGDNNGDTVAHGAGMSYCYGCKDSIADFDDEVVNCPAQGTDPIIDRENDPDQTNYRGNVGTQAATEDQPEQTCQVGAADQGAGQWAGLYARELRRWARNAAGEAPQAFNPSLWAGIDCSGFAQRVIGAAKEAASGENVTIPSPTSWIASQDFFTASRVFYQDRVSDQSGQVDQQKRLSRGDLVRYFVPGRVAHISVFYSDQADGAGDYRIIHAFGNRYSDHDNNEDTDPVFSRKVIVTGNRANNTISNPTGYGRIRLWD